ncbi:hypothetical protein EJ08DRAFT_691171 [Tothia fuscella]|uniref:Uncharacterized protein n=1 Tax=Tothia fuscella TaxID=1048955 RepID=A0A9P4P413_9PEZI|nr:hypothetical protein EJ08DRAFT_691171 [Tothia fuscella]
MASRQQIAKQELASALGKDDKHYANNVHEDVGREPANDFDRLVKAAVTTGTYKDIQTCIQWINTWAISSPARLAAIGRYLAQMASSYGFIAAAMQDKPAPQASKVTLFQNPREDTRTAVLPRQPSLQRQRIHVMWIINEMLHSASKQVALDLGRGGAGDRWSSAAHQSRSKSGFDQAAFSRLIVNLRPSIVDIVKVASDCDPTVHVEHHDRIKTTLYEWKQADYFKCLGLNYIEDLHIIEASQGRKVPAGCRDGQKSKVDHESGSKGGRAPKEKRPADWAVPETYGIEEAVWCDHPASSMIGYVKTRDAERGVGIPPRKYYPHTFSPSTDPEEKLVQAVKNLIQAKHAIFNFSLESKPGVKRDINAMGQIVTVIKTAPFKRDGQPMRFIKVPNAYGYSNNFARHTRRDRQKAALQTQRKESERRSRKVSSQSRSRSRSSSGTPPRQQSPPYQQQPSQNQVQPQQFQQPYPQPYSQPYPQQFQPNQVFQPHQTIQPNQQYNQYQQQALPPFPPPWPGVPPPNFGAFGQQQYVAPPGRGVANGPGLGGQNGASHGRGNFNQRGAFNNSRGNFTPRGTFTPRGNFNGRGNFNNGGNYY